MYATVFGMVNVINDSQELKAEFPMRVTEPAMVKFAKELHPEKAQFSMRVTECGMVKLTKDVQYLGLV